MTKRATLKDSSKPVHPVERMMVKRDQITTDNANNKRYDLGDLEGLARSIKHQAVDVGRAGGLLHDVHLIELKEPIDGKKYRLKDGKRRMAAIDLMLEHYAKDPKHELAYNFPEGIGALVSPPMTRLEELIEMAEANAAKNMEPLEEAAFYADMRAEGLTIEGIKAVVSRSGPHVIKTLNLISADDEVKDAVKKGKMGATLAKEIATAAKGDKEAQKELTRRAVSAKDKGELAEVKRDVERKRVEKEAKRGRVAKMRALTDAELNKLGLEVSEALAKLMEEQGIKPGADLMRRIRGDEDMALAFTFGTLAGLQRAAGNEVSLTV